MKVNIHFPSYPRTLNLTGSSLHCECRPRLCICSEMKVASNFAIAAVKTLWQIKHWPWNSFQAEIKWLDSKSDDNDCQCRQMVAGITAEEQPLIRRFCSINSRFNGRKKCFKVERAYDVLQCLPSLTLLYPPPTPIFMFTVGLQQLHYDRSRHYAGRERLTLGN